MKFSIGSLINFLNILSNKVTPANTTLFYFKIPDTSYVTLTIFNIFTTIAIIISI